MPGIDVNQLWTPGQSHPLAAGGSESPGDQRARRQVRRAVRAAADPDQAHAGR